MSIRFAVTRESAIIRSSILEFILTFRATFRLAEVSEARGHPDSLSGVLRAILRDCDLVLGNVRSIALRKSSVNHRFSLSFSA